MCIDKFYRIYTPHENTVYTPTNNVKDGENMGETLTRVNHEFIQGKTKYKIMKTTNNNWDGENKILKNIKTGVESSDVTTVEQILVYDKKVNKFLFNNKYFDLNNALVADDSQLSSFRRMDGSTYLPVNYIF